MHPAAAPEVAGVLLILAKLMHEEGCPLGAMDLKRKACLQCLADKAQDAADAFEGAAERAG